MTTTFETAKVGDRVWCIRFGRGEIRGTDASVDYPIAVHFQRAKGERFEIYTPGGFYDVNDISQTLFWDEVKIEAPQKPLPDLAVDTKVLVWNDPSDKHKRHFSHFSDGLIWTFDSGSTSFTRLHPSSITGWFHWELVE